MRLGRAETPHSRRALEGCKPGRLRLAAMLEIRGESLGRGADLGEWENEGIDFSC